MDKDRNILILVEGKRTEPALFQRMLECFPEVNISPENILVYNTNLWVLNQMLTKSFGEFWYFSEEIDFREYLKSIYEELKGQKITDIFLVFDYERQDERFNAQNLENMLTFFNDSVENGQLYINYPMIEAYKHLTAAPLPDDGYKNRICKVNAISEYKSIVAKEGRYQDVRKLDRELLKQIVIHNIKKASYILGEGYDLTEEEIHDFCQTVDYVEIAKRQNMASAEATGIIYVISTCVLFLAEYNSRLIME